MASEVSAEQDFDPDPSSLRAVRRFVAEALVGMAEVDDVEGMNGVVLVASELATNVVRHAQTRFRVAVDVDEHRTRLEVSDGSSIIPAVEELADSKRGLRVVKELTDEWGVELTETGKTVWAEFTSTRP